VTPTTESPRPRAKSISVADGTRLAILTGETMAVLSDAEIDERTERLGTGWERDGNAIKRVFKFDDFRGSIDFVNRITPVADGMNHHPDLSISWNAVTVSLSTHSEMGVTENDFELAVEIDELE
jgi:4a-hydroxytetrahydrobiopterin dehydratase